MPKRTLFTAWVARAITEVGGRDSGKIAQALFKRHWPKTFASSAEEDAWFSREGLVEAVRSALNRIKHEEAEGSDRQRTLFAVHPDLFPAVEPLQRENYWVPSIGEFRTVVDLVQEIGQLDEAYEYLREVSLATGRSADQLDLLRRRVRQRLAAGLPVVVEVHVEADPEKEES